MIQIQNEQPGSYFLELINHFFGIIPYFVDANPGSGMEKFGSGIQDKNPGSGIQDKNPCSGIQD
jgi:hypothetical protein